MPRSACGTAEPVGNCAGRHDRSQSKGEYRYDRTIPDDGGEHENRPRHSRSPTPKSPVRDHRQGKRVNIAKARACMLPRLVDREALGFKFQSKIVQMIP